VTSLVAAERAFVVFRRGEIRDDILRFWRNGLRKLIDPSTGVAYTEDAIASSTARQSRWWIEADLLDAVLLAAQQRGLYLANQIRPDRASTGFLRRYHRDLWGLVPLPATGGSGPVAAPATVGSVFVGSTTIPDPIATKLRDAAGNRYQVLFTITATANGAGSGVPGANLTLKGIDTGEDTNLPSGSVLTYIENQPLGVNGDPTASDDFRDGAAAERDADYARRIMDHQRHRPASGNPAHFRAWAREASVSVFDAYVYPCAFHAGSTLVVITSKRGVTAGPDGRIPTDATLQDVRAELTPPGSPRVPRPPHVLVVRPVARPSDLVLSLAMRKGSSAGWTDATPWPHQDSGTPTTITAVTDQQNIEITQPAGADGLPAGVTAPSMMVWDPDTSRLEKLVVQSVTAAGGDAYDVVLATAPATTLAVGQYISPDNGRRGTMDVAIEAYFDSLGPGEVIDLDTDDRAHRAFRFPEALEQAPQRVGSGVLTYLRDALSAAIANETLESASPAVPILPTDPADGPDLMVAGHVGLYAE